MHTDRRSKIFSMKNKPKALIFSGYGLNCEDETKFAFDRSAVEADIVHINDLIATPKLLNKYQIAVFPGGFSYGDDLGSGRAFGLRVHNHLGSELSNFLSRDTLMIGICNGFQILTASGILPGALLENSGVRYLNRWVDLKVTSKSPWLMGIDSMSLPIAHGEGRFYMPTKDFEILKKSGAQALQYYNGELSRLYDLLANPNGAQGDTAAITGYGGRVLGMMPHPERAQFFTQQPNWPNIRDDYNRNGRDIPEDGPGIAIFKNAARYFS